MPRASMTRASMTRGCGRAGSRCKEGGAEEGRNEKLHGAASYASALKGGPRDGSRSLPDKGQPLKCEAQPQPHRPPQPMFEPVLANRPFAQTMRPHRLAPGASPTLNRQRLWGTLG